MADQRDYEDYPALGYSRHMKRGADGIFRFELDEINAQVGTFKSLASAQSSTVYTVPTGKKFLLRSLIVYGGAKTTTLALYSSQATAAGLKLKIRVAGASFVTSRVGVNITGLEGFYFTTYVKAKLSSNATGAGVSIGGILDPQADV